MKVKAKVNNVAFSKESKNGYWMIILTNLGTFKGTMSDKPKANTEYEFNGEWTVYNGQKEFKFMGSLPVVPVDTYALLCYVANNAKGIGPKLRDAIWEEHGKLWETKFRDSDIKGLTDTKSLAIIEALEEAKLNEVQVKVISFLMQHECSELLAYKAWNEWKKDAITVVEGNCFKLTELFNVGFGHIDGKIRESFDMPFTDPRRVQSGVEYAYKQCASSGATAIPTQELIAECNRVLRINNEILSKVLQIMLDENKFKLFAKGGVQYFVLWESYVHELTIWDMIKRSVENG